MKIFREQDCKIEVINLDPPGGQHVAYRNFAVKVTHLPTETSAQAHCRSQHKSRQLAMEMVEWGVACGDFQ